MTLFVGVEGGGTKSEAICVNEKGVLLATEVGQDTNVWIIGIDELVARLEELLTRLWVQLGEPEGTKFDSVCLAISGGSQEAMIENIINNLTVSKNYKHKSFKSLET
jgi:N-acetylglucosamine kinase-like BadF-type ATPase